MNSFFPPSLLFNAFIAPHCNRLSFIEAWLKAAGIPSRKITLAGKTHLIIKFNSSFYDPRFRAKTLIAHYDRVPQSPGANDNSAACFLLMDLAYKLQSRELHAPIHNCTIIFTDGEEAAGTNGVKAQGAYALGEGFRRLGIRDSDIYVFDACGRGDILIISTSGMYQKTKKKLQDSLERLHDRTAILAAKTSPESWARLLTPFSDNAGLLASGIASQVITVLPQIEASLLIKDADHKPETWKIMHTEKDTVESLTPEAFKLVSRFLEQLALLKTPLF